jgi:hypothetical protein
VTSRAALNYAERVPYDIPIALNHEEEVWKKVMVYDEDVARIGIGERLALYFTHSS